MAKFKQGEGGRPKGSPNRVTAELREWITLFIASNKELIQQDFETLDAKDRLLIFEKLLKYALPALQSTSLTTDFDRMSDEQLDRVIGELKQQAT